MGQQESGGATSDEGNVQRPSDDSDPDEGEAGGGHFSKGPWLSLCSAVDCPIAEEGASDAKGGLKWGLVGLRSSAPFRAMSCFCVRRQGRLRLHRPPADARWLVPHHVLDAIFRKSSAA